MSKQPEQESMHCLRNGCALGHNDSIYCIHCGFEEAENERRKGIPLVKNEDGLWSKHVHSSFVVK